MKEDFIDFSKMLDTVRSSDVISFKKLYNKKLNIFLLTSTEIAKNEVLGLQKSFNDFFVYNNIK